MFDVRENHILTKSELSDLSKQGYNVDEPGIYVIKFLFNDKWNNAADPRPFRIKPELVQKLAADAIDMPYIVNPNTDKKHLRGTDAGGQDTAKDLLAIQAQYSIGMIKAPIITPTNNVYGIIKVWPEYEKLVLEDKLPAFTSPTINVLKEDADGIEDAQFLNVNAVGNPGYSKILAGITGICKGGIKQCMMELAPLGAAGSLETSRKDPQSFSLIMNRIGLSMSQAATTPSLDTLSKDVEGIKSELSSVKQDLGSQKTMLESIAAKVGVDNKPADANPPMGAAGKDEGKTGQQLEIPKELKDNPYVQELHSQVLETKKSLDEIKKDAAKKAAQAAANLRKAQAESIVSRTLPKTATPEQKEAEIKKYVELKDEAGSLKDLEVLDNFLKSTTDKKTDNPEEVVGAAGDDIPEIGGDHDTISMSNSEVQSLMENLA
jgi:hypothetical protein